MNIQNGKGIVVSDLHIGRPDTHGDISIVEMAQQVVAHQPSLIVLNGDIIEAKEYPGNYEQTLDVIDDAVRRIRGLVQAATQENPDCKIVYVMGNHDCRYEVADRLANLQQEFPQNFLVEEVALKVKDALFTHGDLQLNYDHYATNNEIVKAGLKRKLVIAGGRTDAREHGDEGHSSWKHVKGFEPKEAKHVKRMNRLIGAVDTLCSKIVFPLEQVMEAVHGTLKAHDETLPEGQKLLDGVKTICMGHIHPRYNTVREHEGVTFRFTGPATQFSKNTMLLFDIGDDGLDHFQTFEQARKDWRAATRANPELKVNQR